jgi:predicted nucleic acid-binding protein
VPAGVLVDSNVLLDVVTGDRSWSRWSLETLERVAAYSILVINPVIYAEVSAGYDSIEDLDAMMPASLFRRDPLPYEAGFLAGKAFVDYRRRGGTRRSPLPDFYIGAHAAVAGLQLLTRDARRYRTYFPRLEIVAPSP